MALFVRKLCRHERTDKVESKFRPDNARSKAQHIHVVVFHALVG
jgi:hypothetical protein